MRDPVSAPTPKQTLLLVLLPILGVLSALNSCPQQLVVSEKCEH